MLGGNYTLVFERVNLLLPVYITDFVRSGIDIITYQVINGILLDEVSLISVLEV